MSGTVDDPSTFPLPPIPPVGSVSYPGGTPYDPTVPSPAGWGLQDYNASNVGTNATAIGKALKDLQDSLKPAQQGGTSSPQGTPSGQSQSGTGQGSSAGLNALINMLLQRSNQYFPGQPNRQPVALARPSGGGLLGI